MYVTIFDTLVFNVVVYYKRGFQSVYGNYYTSIFYFDSAILISTLYYFVRSVVGWLYRASDRVIKCVYREVVGRVGNRV